jgi:hypothetical protein
MKGSTQDLKKLLAVATMIAPNVFLLLISPNPNGLRGVYYEIFTVAPNFALYYSLIMAASLGLMAISVIKKSALAGLAAYAVIAPSFFMPRAVNGDWLTYVDILDHGGWIISSPVHFAQISTYGLWPGAWALWLFVCRVLSLNVIQGSIVMLGADWCFRIVGTLVLARLLVRQSGLGTHLSYVLASLMLVFSQNHGFLLNTYYDAALAQSFSILFIYLLIRGITTPAQVVALATVWTAIVVTHPFYTIILGVVAICFFIEQALHSRKKPSLILIALVTISLVWNIYYASLGIQSFLFALLAGSPRSVYLRPETLQAPSGLPFYGIVIDQGYKFVALPLVALLFIIYLFRGKLPRASKILVVLYLVGAAWTWFIFLVIPYFEFRAIIFTLFGLTMLAGLQIANLASGSLRRKIIALALLILLFPTPFFITLQPPVYGPSVTQSIQVSVAFATHYPSPYFAALPVDIPLRYSDPYLSSLKEIGSPYYATSVQVVNPQVGLTVVLTLPPGQLSKNIFENVAYSAEWNSSDKVYVSGGVEAYYTL